MANFKRLLCFSALPILTFISLSDLVHAQAHTSVKPTATITVDGNLNEWGDSLRYYNEAQKINYAIANDASTLYIAVRIGERSQQARVLNNGLTISLNTKGKKKDTYSVTFPVGNENNMQRPAMQKPENAGDIYQEDHDEMMNARLTSLRNIKVTGFKDVESDIITTANTYGFKTALNYDKGYLIYEAAIPLKLLDYTAADKSEWAVNFKVNGMKQPEANTQNGSDAGGMGGMGRGGMGGGRGGMGGGGRGGMRGGGMGRGGMAQGSFNRGDMFKSVDFWDKFTLQ